MITQNSGFHLCPVIIMVGAFANGQYASLENCRFRFKVQQAENLMIQFGIPCLDITVGGRNRHHHRASVWNEEAMQPFSTGNANTSHSIKEYPERSAHFIMSVEKQTRSIRYA